MTPFHAAAERGREQILGYLFDKGGYTCINIEAENGVSTIRK